MIDRCRPGLALEKAVVEDVQRDDAEPDDGELRLEGRGPGELERPLAALLGN